MCPQNQHLKDDAQYILLLRLLGRPKVKMAGDLITQYWVALKDK